MNPDLIIALKISGIGIAGVFLFMTLFYFVIIGIDKLFPNEENKPAVTQKSASNADSETY